MFFSWVKEPKIINSNNETIISISSQSLCFTLTNDYGIDSLSINGRFYEKTREYILQKAHILDISIVPKKMSNQFIGTNMEVIIFTLKKYENPPVNKNYVAIKKNIKIFSSLIITFYNS